MTDQQGRLPLNAESRKHETNSSATEDPPPTKDPSSVLSDTLRTLNRARKAISLVRQNRDTSPIQALGDLDKAIAALQNLISGDALSNLEQERNRLVHHRDNLLTNMRADLKRSAEDAGWVVTRRAHYDYVGCFTVGYKQKRVTVHVGSEMFATIDEVDGNKLFTYLQEARNTLDGVSFDRKDFFQTLKGAISLSRTQGLSRQGKVPIRPLYPMMVLVWQSRAEGFLKEPTQRLFTDYSRAQFVYDIARFGRDGWTLESERLASQTPNMATIGRGATMTLPSLDGQRSTRHQIGALWIETT